MSHEAFYYAMERQTREPTAEEKNASLDKLVPEISLVDGDDPRYRRMIDRKGDLLVARRAKNYHTEHCRPQNVPVVQDKLAKGVFRTTARFPTGEWPEKGTKPFPKWKVTPPDNRLGHIVRGEELQENGNIAKTSYVPHWGENGTISSAFHSKQTRVASTAANVKGTVSHPNLKTYVRELENPHSSIEVCEQDERVWRRAVSRAVSTPALVKNTVQHPRLKGTCRELAVSNFRIEGDDRVAGFAPAQDPLCPKKWRFGQPKKPFIVTETPAGTLVHQDPAPLHSKEKPHPSVPRKITKTSNDRMYPHCRFPNPRYSGKGQFPWWREEEYADSIGPQTYKAVDKRDLNKASSSQFLDRQTGKVKESAVFKDRDRHVMMDKNLGIYDPEEWKPKPLDMSDFDLDGDQGNALTKVFQERRKEEKRKRNIMGTKLRLQVVDMNPLQMSFEDFSLDVLDPTREPTKVSPAVL